MVDIFNTALYVLITIAVLVIVYIVGINIINANIYPMMYSLRPNGTEGLGETLYVEKLDRLKAGFTWIFMIILAIPFVYIVVKLLYEKEETSVYGGGYQ